MLTQPTLITLKHNSGCILIEALVSLAILAVTLSGFLSATKALVGIEKQIDNEVTIKCSLPSCQARGPHTYCTCGASGWLIIS
jgi:hypothetical protein